MKPTILIESCERHPHSRNYHTTSTLITTKEVDFAMPIERFDNRDLKKIGERGREVVELLMHQIGIIYLHLEPTFMFVVKGKAFDWKTMENNILSALTPTFHILDKKIIELHHEECHCKTDGSKCCLAIQYHELIYE